jgi:NADH-quinone oxidoreductase subunit M
VQFWLWLAFFASFAVKVPMWPVHTWLPDAHVEAPTAGSVILAGVLLKMGGYGFLRFSLPMMPDASVFRAADLRPVDRRHHLHLAGRAGAGGHEEADRLLVGRPHGLRDDRHLHGNMQGIEGAIFQMLSHGIVSARSSSASASSTTACTRARSMLRRPGAPHAALRPRLHAVHLASVGLPGTSGFVGEFLVLIGAFQANTWVAFLATTGMILGAAYMLWLYRRVIFGADHPRRPEEDARPQRGARSRSSRR